MTDQGPRGSDAGAGGWVIESEGTGPGLLCLHGMGGAALWFKGLALRLRNSHRVMALDLPGTGRNRAGHSPFSVERCVEAVLRIAGREAVPVSLLGHSLGTIIALKAFAAAPGLFQSLIFVGGLPAVNPAMRVRLGQRRLRIQAEGMAGIGWSAASGVFARATLEGQPEIAAQYARAFEAIPAEEYLEVLDALLAADAAHAVPSVSAPCLVLTGSEDAYAPPEDSRLFLSTLPGARRGVEIRDCGHMPFLERPEAFSSEIANFLTLRDAPQKT